MWTIEPRLQRDDLADVEQGKRREDERCGCIGAIICCVGYGFLLLVAVLLMNHFKKK